MSDTLPTHRGVKVSCSLGGERLFHACAWSCSRLAAKSPSNKVLRRAFSIVWMEAGPNLHSVDWTNKDGSPQDLYEIWLWLQLP